MSGQRSAPRPKRAGEAFARTHHQEGDGPSSAKKLRFDVRNPSALAPDAPEDDAVLELDEIGKGGQNTKRNAVNLDGFESDSSNEGFDARADAKAEKVKKEGKKGKKAEQEDENDMFADLEDDFQDGDEDEDLAREGKKRKKDVRFLDEGDIEGQNEVSTSGGHVSANLKLPPGQKKSTIKEKGRHDAANFEDQEGEDKFISKEKEESSESEEEPNADEQDVDEEIGAGGRKSHAPKLDAFNMKDEMEEGRFDAQGNFVRKAGDPDSVHDSWLEGLSKKDMKRAREAAEKREEERRQKTIADDQLLSGDILRTLILQLGKSETPLEALARLNKGRPKQKPKWQNKNRNRKKSDSQDQMEVDVEDPANNPVEIKRREAVEAITGAADHLLSRGQLEVYDQERELLQRQYRRETGEDWVDPPAEEQLNGNEQYHDKPETQQWEYRWTDARDGGQANGPYEGPMMIAWQEAGFFGDGVEFRRSGRGDDWKASVEFV
ncbi:MAG: hypothetical protein M4579_000085 [Chaenotheca gracillima]|nr:MAG: hypothetical protein M4579_000085 [Chaenotheca gracillima]